MSYETEDSFVQPTLKYTYVIIGGGIAGVTCLEQLSVEQPDVEVLLISGSPCVKRITNVTKLSERLEAFDVEEESYKKLQINHPNCRVLSAFAVGLDSNKHEILLSNNQKVSYKKLCICTGAKPKVIAKNCPYVIGIRDTETVKDFQKKLSGACRVLIVGNGGIATEMVYEIENCQIIWAVKDKSFGAAFFDPGVARFFLPCLNKNKEKGNVPCKRMKYTISSSESGPTWPKEYSGSALGPDWSTQIEMKGKEESRKIHIEYECEVHSVYLKEEYLKTKLKETHLENFQEKDSWPVYVELTNGNVFGCDFVVSATGVIPYATPFLANNDFKIADDLGIEVDDQMATSLPDVYAAGDICTPSWDLSDHWFQMRLWTQARHMGAYAAKCMVNSCFGQKVVPDVCFDMFSHVTNFFGYKVVLLGLFNGQKLGNDYEMHLRVTEGEEYVKVVMKGGKMQGAILVGETDLEETFENLILGQLDLSAYGEDILNPSVDIEDYFD